MGSGFKKLVVWQRAKDLAVVVYKVSGVGPLTKDFGLRDQMRRAAVSIASNIAEGSERETDKESIRFLFIAKGSAGELQTQVLIAQEIGFLTGQESQSLCAGCDEIARMLSALIKSQKRHLSLS